MDQSSTSPQTDRVLEQMADEAELGLDVARCVADQAGRRWVLAPPKRSPCASIPSCAEHRTIRAEWVVLQHHLDGLALAGADQAGVARIDELGAGELCLASLSSPSRRLSYRWSRLEE